MGGGKATRGNGHRKKEEKLPPIASQTSNRSMLFFLFCSLFSLPLLSPSPPRQGAAFDARSMRQ